MADHRLEIVLAGKDATQRAFKTVSARLNGLTKSVFNLRNAGLAAAGATGLGYFIKSQLEAADAIAKTADAVGVSTDALQEYRYIADRSGVTTSALESGINAFTKRLGELRSEGGTLYKYLEKNNQALINQLQATKTTDEAFEVFLGTLASVENQSDRVALSAAGLGRTAGIRMTNMVSAGTRGLAEMREEFKRLGLNIDEQWLRKSEAAVDQFTNLEYAIKTKFMAAAVQAGPEITGITNRMAEWIGENDEFLTQDIPGYIEKTASGLGKTKDALAPVVSYVANLAGQFNDLPSGIKATGLIGGLMFGKKGAIAIAGGLAGSEMLAKYIYGPLDVTERLQAKLKDLQEQAHNVRDGLLFYRQGSANYEREYGELQKIERQIAQVTTTLEYLRAEESKTQKQTRETTQETAHQLDDLVVHAQTLNEMAIKGPRFGKPDDLPGIITPEMISDYESIFQQTRTPLENLYSDLGRINNMWEVGAFGDDKDTYFRAIEMYGEKFSATFDTVKNEAGETFAYMTDAFSGWAVQYSSELNNMLWDAEFSFKRIAESFGRMITEMMIQKQMMRLSEGVSSWVGGLFASEHGNVFSAGRHVAKYARGGIVDKPTIFPMANGAGLMGEAGAEAIMPLTRINGDLGVKAQTGPQNVRVEIHNDSGQAMEVTEARTEFDAQGMIVNLWIDAYQRNKGGLRNAIGG